jgi:hypothetical protein
LAVFVQSRWSQSPLSQAAALPKKSCSGINWSERGFTFRAQLGVINGSTVQRPSFKGTATYTADGRFHLLAARTDAPEYKSGDLARPSSDEALAASGSFTYTGTYMVDENTKTIHANIETSTFPNFVPAADLRRIIRSITADEMSLTNLDTPGLAIDTVWKRVK